MTSSALRAASVSLVLATLVAQVFGGEAAAQPAGDFAAAAAHYQAAEDAMARAAWTDAIREYTAAYEAGPDPILLFKLGTAQAQAGQCDAARATLDRYLAEANPSPEYRAMAEERAATCVAGTAASAPTGPTGPTTTEPGGHGTTPGTGAVADVDDPDTLPGFGGGPGGPSFTDTPSTWKRSAGWVATGTTVGLVAIATVLVLSAEGSEEDLGALIDFRTRDDGTERPLRWDEIDDQYTDLVSEGERFDRMGTIAFAAAGVTAAAAITFFVLDATTGHHERSGVAAMPRVDRDGAHVSVGWQF